MSLDNWNDYTGKNWLSAQDVNEDKAFIVVKVELSEENKILLTLENDQGQFIFELNVTNSNKCKEFTKSPKDLNGRKVYFRKVKVISPQTKKEVDALRIYNVVE